MAEDTIAIRFELNGAARAANVPPQRMLVDLLREDFALTGTKVGCDQAVCGACTVLMDGVPVAACATFAWQVDGRRVLTIEGLAREGRLDPVQAAFKAKSAFQCGYCTPGMILLAKALLDRDPEPSRETIKDWLSANICRCTGYQMIVEAVEDAAEALRERAPAEAPR
jgi:carbon-monoxide dehydrogenase small subunit